MKYIIIILLFLVVSCTIDRMEKFDYPASIYVATPKISKSFVFAEDDIKKDTIYIPIMTSGKGEDRKRYYSIEQVVEYPELTYIYNEDGNITDSIIDAKQGIHFENIDNDEFSQACFIDSHKFDASIPIVLIRHPDLNNHVFRIKIRLLPSQDFILDFDDSQHTSCEVSFTDMPVKSIYWDMYIKPFWGEFSRERFYFIIKSLNIILDDNLITNLEFHEKEFMKIMLQKELQKYNEGKDPKDYLKDEYGNFIQF